MFTNDERPVIRRNGVFGFTVARRDALIQQFSRMHTTQPHNKYKNGAPLIRCLTLVIDTTVSSKQYQHSVAKGSSVLGPFEYASTFC